MPEMYEQVSRVMVLQSGLWRIAADCCSHAVFRTMKLSGFAGFTWQKTLAAITLLFIIAGCASGPPSYRTNIQSAIGGRGSVNVFEYPDGVVVLRGWLEDSYDLRAVVRAAKSGEGVNKVISYILIHQD